MRPTCGLRSPTAALSRRRRKTVVQIPNQPLSRDPSAGNACVGDLSDSYAAARRDALRRPSRRPTPPAAPRLATAGGKPGARGGTGGARSLAPQIPPLRGHPVRPPAPSHGLRSAFGHQGDRSLFPARRSARWKGANFRQGAKPPKNRTALPAQIRPPELRPQRPARSDCHGRPVRPGRDGRSHRRRVRPAAAQPSPGETSRRSSPEPDVSAKPRRGLKAEASQGWRARRDSSHTLRRSAFGCSPSSPASF